MPKPSLSPSLKWQGVSLAPTGAYWAKPLLKMARRQLSAYWGGKQIRDENSGFVDLYDDIRAQPAFFVEVKNIPPPNSWLKNEKWFWCDEQDYWNWRKKSKLQ